MTVVSSEKDVDTLTVTFVAEFDAPVERVWQLWMDPRQLERWWGPPSYPATFEQLDFRVGGTAGYYMTGPEGDTPHGWWRITAIDAPHHLEFDDGFSEQDGTPLTQDQVHMAVTLEAIDGGTRMTSVTTFSSLEHLERMAAMGMQEGMRLAMEQMDDILA